MSDPPSPTCYKCGALDHVATNRNCPRHRTKTTIPSTPLASESMLPPLTLRNAKATVKASQRSRPTYSGQKFIKSSRRGDETKFWYYEPSNNDTATISDTSDTDKVQSESEDNFGLPKHPGKAVEKSNQQTGKEAAHSAPFNVPASSRTTLNSPTKDPEQPIMSMKDFARQLQNVAFPALVSKRSRSKKQRSSGPNPHQRVPRPSLPEAESPFVRRPPTKKIKLSVTSSYRAQLFATTDGGPQCMVSSSNDTSSAEQLTRQGWKTIPPIETPAVQTSQTARRRKNASKNWEDVVVEEQEPAKSQKPKGPPPEATWGEIFEWYDRPENDEYSSLNRAKIRYNYVSNRNVVARPNGILYGRHLQGWRECRSVGMGLGHWES